MDLRRRLVGYLGALLLALLLVSVLINLHALRDDVSAEVIASERLVNVLLDTSGIKSELSPAEVARRLAAIVNDGSLRHITISTISTISTARPVPKAAQSSLTTAVAAMLGVEATQGAARQLRFGDQTLFIAPNPASEIDERLDDTVRLCITLLLFSGATLLVAWWSTDRALAPVRALEDGLMRLADGASDAALPAFALREFARVAGAIDTLAKALSASRDAQQQLAHRLIRVQEDERSTLAMELHDELGQTLTAISVTAVHLERNAGRLDPGHIAECAQDLRRDVRTSGEQLRAMLKRLRPHCIDASALASALRELVNGWQQREAGIVFTLQMPATLPPLCKDGGLTLYRVVQEALTNVVKHSKAAHCRVRIDTDADVLRLQIEDDGVGLPVHGTAGGNAGANTGYGLPGIAQRLQMVGGRLAIGPGNANATAAGRGLRLDISLPLIGQPRQQASQQTRQQTQPQLKKLQQLQQLQQFQQEHIS
jgi:two-component system sensor histidine kinase UhpB